MSKLLFDESENAALAHFPNTEVAPQLLRSCCLCCTCFAWIVTGAVFLVHRHCGVLPQPLGCICDVSDALNAPDLASKWWYDLVSRSSHCQSSDLSSARFESSLSTQWVRELNGSFRVVGRWCGRLRYIRCDVAFDLLELTLISS